MKRTSATLFGSRLYLLPLIFALALPLRAQLSSLDAEFDATSDTVGRKGHNQFETPTHQRLTPAGILVELPGMRPQTLALSPDKRLLVTSGLTHEIVCLNPATGQILQRVALPPDQSTASGPVSSAFLNADLKAQASYTGLTFSPDGSRIYLANVNGNIKVFTVDRDHKVAALTTLPLPPAKAPRRAAEIPAGIAVSPDGKRLYVAFNLSNRLAEMDAATGEILRTWDVGVDPYGVVLSGHKVYVSNWAGRRPAADSLTGPAGRGTVMRVNPVHFSAAEGTVSVIDLDRNVCTTEILTGLHACAMAISPDGRYVVAANASSDTLSIIDTGVDRVVETLCVRQEPGDPFGAQPNGLAFDKTGTMLFVCNGTQNAVALVRFEPGNSRLLGLIPVGWFPGAVVYDARHKTICVANIKGLTPGRPKKGGAGTEFNSKEYHGSISLVRVPSKRRLQEFTRATLADLRYPLLARAKLPPRPEVPARPVPERVGEPSVFKHVIYIIKENRTYDQVLGDMKEGNGDPSLCIFGERVTPNLHKISREFILLDNTYCSSSLSADGHHWADSGIVTDYLEKNFNGFPRSYPAAGDILTEDAMAYSPAGFIWDDVISHGKTFRDYGEYATAHVKWKDSTRKGHPHFLDCYEQFTNKTDNIAIWSEPNVESVRPYLVTNTVGWDLGVPDVFRASQFIKELRRFEQTGNLPHLAMIWVPNDHTSGTSPHTPTPAAHVADNDLAIGRIVEALSHSKYWRDTCLFCIEDDPQAGWDHVSGYRTTAYVVSAYTRRHQTIHTQFNQPGVLRTIELILGIPPMNQLDATATPMFDCFTDLPDFTPYDAVANNIPLDQLNPAPKRIADPLLRKDAYASAKLPLDQPDQCPEDLLNRILWRAMAGPRQPYPQWATRTVEDD